MLEVLAQFVNNDEYAFQAYLCETYKLGVYRSKLIDSRQMLLVGQHTNSAYQTLLVSCSLTALANPIWGNALLLKARGSAAKMIVKYLSIR